MSKQKNNNISNNKNNNINNVKESKAQKKAQQVVDAYVDKSQLKSDPMGSWTGKPQNSNEVPVQDADDL
ncbi:MAG: hypothetical protein E7410_07245 [Ruminococcaceae bacterium]|nr:hypothetical protein [Oscillospiraceae bacterium]